MDSPAGTCPRCRVPLERVVSPVGLRLRCPACDGQAVAEAVLARLTSEGEAHDLLLAAAQPVQPVAGDFTQVAEDLSQPHEAGAAAPLLCPWCAGPMRPAAAESSERTADGLEPLTIAVDVCRSCQVVWFDAGELERIPRGTTVRTPAAPKPIVCEECGAPARPDLDAYCHYCGHPLAPAEQPTTSDPKMSDPTMSDPTMLETLDQHLLGGDSASDAQPVVHGFLGLLAKALTTEL